MSRKQIYGITLTTEERRMAGYDRTPGLARANNPAPTNAPRQQGITSHACRVTMPDDTTCDVNYTRYGGGGSHVFTFQPPLSEREYGNDSLADQESIEARAQELVGRVWRKAQDAEQKRMRLPSAPSNLVHTLDKTPQLTQKTAKQFAGLYAVCLRYPSGILTPLSAACERRVDALNDLERMQAENKQTLVVGLCCQWARHWQEPRFLPDASAENDAQATASVNALSANAANANTPVSSPQAEDDEDATDLHHDGVEEEEEEEDYREKDYDYPDEPDPDGRDPGDPFEAAQT